MLIILPFRGKTACVLRFRAFFAGPSADLPSTINISQFFLSLLLASLRIPGSIARFFVSALRTVSLAFFAFSLAARANSALSTIALASFSFDINQTFKSLETRR